MEYTSVKFVKIKNTPLAITFYVVNFLVLCYIAYAVVSDRQYMYFDDIVSNTFLKMKGSAHTAAGLVVDQYDAVVPPILPNAIFIGTNFQVTPSQTPNSVCAGVAKNEVCECDLGSLALCCPEGGHSENGMYTGKCSNDTIHCEMKGWCPIETKPDDPNENLLIGVDDWTLFARINGKFPKWGDLVSNTEADPEMELNKGLVLWDMQGLAHLAGTSMDDMRQEGGIILATVRYDCNLRRDENCGPEINFERLNDPTSDSLGFNFRFHHNSRDLTTGAETRDLWKIYGVYVVFQVFGQGSRFDWLTLLVNLGSLVAYFSMATLFCDIVLEYFLPERQFITDEKFKDIQSRLASIQDMPGPEFDQVQHSGDIGPLSDSP